MRGAIRYSGKGGPGPAEKGRLKLTTVWAEARELIWRHRVRLGLGLVILLVNAASSFVLPFMPKLLIDEVIGKGRRDLLTLLVWAAAAATLVQAGTSFALSQVLGVAAQRAITDLRKELQAFISRLPVSYFDANQTGQLISRIMSDAEGIRNLVGTGFVQLVGGTLKALAALAILCWLNWELTCLTLLVLLLFGGMLAFAFARLRPLFRERGRINAEVTGRLSEALSGIRVVKAYHAERREEAVFARGAHRLFRNVAKAVTGVSAVNAFSILVVGLIGLVILFAGGRAVVDGRMSTGDLMTYLLFTGLMAAPVIQMASIGTQIAEAFAGLDRIREVRALSTEDQQDLARQPLGELRGEIAFEEVHFEYKPGVEVLKGIGFRAPAGTTTALVGPSGSGKSTLVSLVMAFNRPTRGRILVDGRDLAGIRLGDFRSQLGVVLQDNFLFDGTIRDNVRFARPYAGEEELLAACRIAHCDEFIEGFEGKYDTVTGERGIRLSGGQRQRIAIARAILAAPRILILDEATSSLDSESEAKIQDGLRSLRKGRTTFVIAHRLSTIRSADQILVLDQGRIVERGTHPELLALGGLYRQLHDRQYVWESDRFINPGEEFDPEGRQSGAPERGNAQETVLKGH